jgi:hypothetical protein
MFHDFRKRHQAQAATGHREATQLRQSNLLATLIDGYSPTVSAD